MSAYIVTLSIVTLLVLPVAVRVGRWLSDWDLDVPSKFGQLNEEQLDHFIRRYP